MKTRKIFYIIAVLGILNFLIYKECEFIEELTEIKKQKIEKREEFTSRLNENYKPRKTDFYKNEN